MRRLPFTVALLILCNSPAALAGFHFGVGPVDEIEGKRSGAAALSWETEHKHPWEFMGGVIRQRQDPAIRTPRVYFASISKRFTLNRWFAQGGITATNSDTDVLSAHWQFQTGIGYRYERFTLSLRHLSNANTGGRNRGENILLLQYGF